MLYIPHSSAIVDKVEMYEISHEESSNNFYLEMVNGMAPGMKSPYEEIPAHQYLEMENSCPYFISRWYMVCSVVCSPPVTLQMGLIFSPSTWTGLFIGGIRPWRRIGCSSSNLHQIGLTSSLESSKRVDIWSIGPCRKWDSWNGME
ncbi:uncharacterized protein MCYG_05975 [Microsporum canis CBS 113480]|uniref:Uncharacterized protein n=1 Tax=Arthroderma otae (strain ATCC MYA-4605 / CBS 113480) TaxID=554155 RepID=C5FTF3_ARTOC|nr:uncharacterized protein MCYG_05975 [Microsporum canis CBS 113480]EEQ33156.1 hypothetical protein MCYG_05975 [Microsporum canis CBS 113480]